MQSQVKNIVNCVRAGGLILYPGDIAWAIGCDATNEHAVAKLIKLIKETSTHPYTVLIDNLGRMQAYFFEIPDVVWDLMELSEKPLTVIMGDTKNLATNLLGNDNTIGIRLTSEVVSRDICAQLRKPLVCFSLKHTDYDEIPQEIVSGVDQIAMFEKKLVRKHAKESIIKIDETGLFKIIQP